MNRVITNTFTLAAVKDNEAIRENLLYCSLFNEQRMSWWLATRSGSPSVSYIGNDKPIGGVYAMDGYNLFELHAKPGQMEDLRQQLFTIDSNGYPQPRLKSNTWYTLSFKVRGVLRDKHDDGTFTDFGECPVVLYVTNNVVGLPTGIIDPSAGVIIDGTQTKPYPYGDMSVLIKCGWAITTHTITFKTGALVSNSESANAPTLFIRSFGKGYSGLFAEEFVNGGAYFRVAALKLEEGQEATAFVPHTTETLSPIYSTAFIRSVDTPSAPSGGSYSSPNPTTGGSYSSPNPTTGGWSDSIPSTGDGRLWASSATFYPEVSGATWSTPAPMTDTSKSDMELCPYDGIPNSPSETEGEEADWNLAPKGIKPSASTKLWFDINRNSDLTKEEWATMIWRAECQIENGKRGAWWISKIKGEDGTSFTAKGSAEKHYASLDAYNADTDRVVGKYYLVDSTSGAVMYKYDEPDAIACNDGDAYTTSDSHLWVKNGPIWADLGKIQGPQGPQGAQGPAGQNTVRLDLDNEMDSVVCDNNGYLLAATTIHTTLRLYDGASPANASTAYNALDENFGISGEDSSKVIPWDGTKCAISWTFKARTYFGKSRYTKDFSIQYNGVDYLATFTLNAMRNGENGDDAVRYNVSASESAISFKRQSDNSLSPSSVVLKCNVVKAVGETISLVSSDSYNVPGASLYLYYKRVGQDTDWQTLTISSGKVTVRSSDKISAIKFCLSTASSYSNVDSNIIDIETVPVIIDGLNGNNGVTIDFLSSANTIMLDDSGVEPKSITFRAMSAQGENAPSGITSSMYKIKVTEYVGNSAGSSLTVYCFAYTSGYTWTISNTTTLTKIVAELIYNDGGNDTTIRTLTIPVVKKGADGRSYNPVPRGVYAAGNTYVWNAIQRDYVDYEFGGVYYRFGVKTYGTSVTAAPTKAEGDDYWEVCNRVSCLITNCIFGTNAVIGGFVATEGKFMSSENAYALRYMRSYETTNKVNYRGAWKGSGTSYAKDDAVYYNGTYYYSMTSGNTATPSGSSNWASCSNLLIERIKEVGTGTVYLYEYDNTTLKRPVVQLGGTYYTTKKMGAATTSPTSSNSNWRELTDNELSFLSVGNGNETTSILSYVPKYTLNGKNGTVMMLQADDTCWTYDDTGKQVNGIPYGKRVEIVPASKSIDVYNEKGELALQVNGDTYKTIDKAYGSGTLNPSCPTNSITGSLKSDDVGRQKTTMSIITNSDFVVKDYPLNLSVECAYRVTAAAVTTDKTPSGNYGDIITMPYPSGGQWVYRSDCRGSIMVQKLSEDGLSWSNHNLLTSISTVGIHGYTARYTGTSGCVLQPGTYRLVFVFAADLFGSSNTGSQSICSYNITSVSATGSYAVKTSRVFSNGLAFGSATNDNFVVCREKEGIHVKASTLSDYGFELSQTEGLEVKREGQQGIVPVLLYAGRSRYISSTNKGTEHLYNAYSNSPSGQPNFDWQHIGICKITLPSTWPCTDMNCVPTVTTWQGATGVSARIASWSGKNITIEIDNDYSSGANLNSDHDYGGFYIKLEYIGTSKIKNQ